MTPSLFWRTLCNRNTQNSIARILSRNLSTSDRHNFAITKTDPPINITDSKQEFNDFIEEATGSEKKQLLALLQGDDRYEPKVYHRGPGTKDMPNIVPLHGESRMVGCVCEPDQCYINYMIVNMGEVKRCECGYWFKSVEGEAETHH